MKSSRHNRSERIKNISVKTLQVRSLKTKKNETLLNGRLGEFGNGGIKDWG